MEKNDSQCPLTHPNYLKIAHNQSTQPLVIKLDCVVLAMYWQATKRIWWTKDDSNVDIEHSIKFVC